MTKGKKTAGSGGRIRKGLEGRGPTPRAEDRVYHKAYKEKQARAKHGGPQHHGKSDHHQKGAGADWVVGRNPVLEALQAGLPVRSAYVAEGADRDSRLRAIFAFTAEHSLPMLQVTRSELDRLTGGAVHQGVALQLKGFEYADSESLLADALTDQEHEALIVALDGITDPHNLGAIIRSAAAFGAHGIVIPNRRSATMTAVAWKSSAGAAARIPVAQVTNLNRFLDQAKKAGCTVVGLAGEAEQDIAAIPGLSGALVLVVGSEGEGLSRLTKDKCDFLASIPISGRVESLNASVAAGVSLYEVSRVRS